MEHIDTEQVQNCKQDRLDIQGVHHPDKHKLWKIFFLHQTGL